MGAAVAQALMVTSEESAKVPQSEDVSVGLTKIYIMRRLLQLKHDMRTVCVCVCELASCASTSFARA